MYDFYIDIIVLSTDRLKKWYSKALYIDIDRYKCIFMSFKRM